MCFSLVRSRGFGFANVFVRWRADARRLERERQLYPARWVVPANWFQPSMVQVLEQMVMPTGVVWQSSAAGLSFMGPLNTLRLFRDRFVSQVVEEVTTEEQSRRPASRRHHAAARGTAPSSSGR